MDCTAWTDNLRSREAERLLKKIGQTLSFELKHAETKREDFQQAVAALDAMLLQRLADCCKLSCRPASSESTCTEMAIRRDG